MDKLKELTRNHIWIALADYFRHADSDDIFNDITDAFVDRLADDSIHSKHALRQFFCQSQGWNKNLQAIVINGTKTHNPDYILVHNLANSILHPAKLDADYEKLNLIDRAIYFFSRPNNKNYSYINAIETLAPQAYAPRKKRSRIFKAICDSLGVTDLSAGSQFQHLFAQFADELSTKKIDFKLFMSIHLAHFLEIQNYYQIATNISKDASKLNRTVMTVVTNRLKGISRKGRKLTPSERTRYGKSAMLRYLADEPIYLIGYVQHKFARCNSNQAPVKAIDEIHCHHKIPKAQGGTDDYQNLIRDATIQKYLQACNPNFKKLNVLRELVGNNILSVD